MDILHISNILPKMVTDFLSGSRSVSLVTCGFQVFLSLTLLGGKCLLLAAMSYGRCVAMFHPHPILTNEYVSVLMATASWLAVTVNSVVHTAFALHFPFCGSRAIDHFFCEDLAMLKLSCVDSSCGERGVYVSGIICLLIPFCMISASYVQILLTVLPMKSSEAQKKSLSTCSFHMIVVVMYYRPSSFTYMRPKSYHIPGQGNFLAIFYTILPSTLNPIIYSFRNKDVLVAIKKCSNESSASKNG